MLDVSIFFYFDVVPNCRLSTTRAKRTKPVDRPEDIQWEFSYAGSSTDSEEAIKEVCDLISLFGTQKGYFTGLIAELEHQTPQKTQTTAQK